MLRYTLDMTEETLISKIAGIIVDYSDIDTYEDYGISKIANAEEVANYVVSFLEKMSS